MISLIVSQIFTTIANAQTQSPVDLDSLPTKPVDGMDVDTLRTIASGVDWKKFAMEWLFASPAGVFGVCLALIFGFLFYRRWNDPRNGIFMLTGSVILVRTLQPTIIFWQVFAPIGAVFSLFLFFMIFRNKQFFALKEPTYFLFNFFALFCMSFPVNFFTIIMSGTSMSLSLFFIITRPNSSPEKFKGTDADHNILDSLSKRAKRKL